MLSILGGCTTRDIFRISKTDALVDHLWARTTVPSIMARPVTSLMYEDSFSPSNFEIRQSFIDANKLFFSHFAASKPSILLMDFMSEIYRLGSSGGGLVTLADQTSRRMAELGIELPAIPPFSDERASLMTRSLPIFLDRLTDEFGTTVLVHEIYQSELISDPRGVITSFPPDTIGSIRKANRHLAQIYGFIKSNLPEVRFFRGDNDLALADSEHSWGLSPFHLTSNYSISALKNLQDCLGFPGRSQNVAETAAPSLSG